MKIAPTTRRLVVACELMVIHFYLEKEREIHTIAPKRSQYGVASPLSEVPATDARSTAKAMHPAKRVPSMIRKISRFCRNDLIAKLGVLRDL